MRIFISGGSGLGKTTFTKALTGKTGLPIKGEVIRSLYDNNKDLFNMPFHVRQQIIFAEYLKLHQSNEEFISDRSVLDIGLWTNVNAPMIRIESYVKYINPEDVVIVVPTPSKQHYYDNPMIFFGDPLRFESYYQTEVYKYMTREEAWDPNNRQAYLDYVWRLTRELEHKFLALSKLGDFKVIYHEANPDNFYDWQNSAIQDLIKLNIIKD